MKSTIKKTILLLGIVYTPLIMAQIDYSKVKTNKTYVYEGDVAHNRINSYDTSQSRGNTNGSARDNTNAKIKSI